MYICIDVGGTKTLIACLDDNGVIIEQEKVPTAPDYQDFLVQVKKVISSFENKDFKVGAIGVPAAKIDRVNQIAVSLPNVPWHNVDIGKDIAEITKCQMFVENDSKLAGLSEAMMVKDSYSRVLYVTVSTGIGYAIINNLEIDINAGDAGGRLILFERGGKHVPWESFASGQAILERYGEMAKDIDDEHIWREISKDLAEGLIELIAIFQPEVIVIGGSVGVYFSKYGDILKKELDHYKLPYITMPVIEGAKRPTEAVVYGCYDYAKQKLDNE
jgi:glucokinase